MDVAAVALDEIRGDGLSSLDSPDVRNARDFQDSPDVRGGCCSGGRNGRCLDGSNGCCQDGHNGRCLGGHDGRCLDGRDACCPDGRDGCFLVVFADCCRDGVLRLGSRWLFLRGSRCAVLPYRLPASIMPEPVPLPNNSSVS